MPRPINLFSARNRDESLWIAGGRYLDHLEKRGGQWKIAFRYCVVEWSGAMPETPLPFADIPDVHANGAPVRPILYPPAAKQAQSAHSAHRISPNGDTPRQTEHKFGSRFDMDDERAIRRSIVLYGQLLDDLRMEEWGRLFTDDAKWAMPGAVFTGRAEIKAGVRAMEPDSPGLAKHLAYEPVIRFDTPARARAWTDLLFLIREKVDDPWAIGVVGRYCDEFVKTAAGWQFSLRVADIAPHEPTPLPCDRSPTL